MNEATILISLACLLYATSCMICLLLESREMQMSKGNGVVLRCIATMPYGLLWNVILNDPIVLDKVIILTYCL